MVLIAGSEERCGCASKAGGQPAKVNSGATPSEAAPVPSSPAESAGSPRQRAAASVRYVVQPGDSLWRIAAALKGDARRWPELLAGSAGVDPARLRPGQELRGSSYDPGPRPQKPEAESTQLKQDLTPLQPLLMAPIFPDAIFWVRLRLGGRAGLSSIHPPARRSARGHPRRGQEAPRRERGRGLRTG